MLNLSTENKTALTSAVPWPVDLVKVSVSPGLTRNVIDIDVGGGSASNGGENNDDHITLTFNGTGQISETLAVTRLVLGNPGKIALAKIIKFAPESTGPNSSVIQENRFYVIRNGDRLDSIEEKCRSWAAVINSTEDIKLTAEVMESTPDTEPGHNRGHYTLRLYPRGDALPDIPTGVTIFNDNYEGILTRSSIQVRNEEVLRLTNHFHDLVVAGDGTYNAAGQFLNFSDIADNLEVKDNTLDISLSGLDAGVLAVILGNNIEGSLVEVFRGFYDDQVGTLVDEPFDRWSGRINNYSIVDDYNFTDEDKITVSVSCKSLLTTIIAKVSGRYTSPQGYQVFNPGDLSMEFTPSLPTFNPNFGAEE